MTGKCPVNPALEGLPLKAGPFLPAGRKGHNIKGKYLTGKPFGILRAVSFAERPRLQGVELHKASGKGIEK